MKIISFRNKCRNRPGRFLSGNRKKAFLCGVMAVVGTMALNAEIIIKDNLKNNYPEVAANVAAASQLAYDNDKVGYYRYLADSKTDNMYVDIDVDGRRIGGGVAALGGDTMYIRDSFRADNDNLAYHEAWHRIQELKLPTIDKLLPPYYAVFMNMVREAGANWYQQIMEEDAGVFPKPAKPAGMSEQEFNNKRFNEFFLRFLSSETYLNFSIDGLKDSYCYGETPRTIDFPAAMNPEMIKYTVNLNGLMQLYMQAYLPDGVKLYHNAKHYLGTVFEPIATEFDAKRAAEGKTTIKNLNAALTESLDFKETLHTTKIIAYTPLVSEAELKKLDNALLKF